MTVPRYKGFTLVEMVLALTVLAILAAVVGPYLSRGAEAYNASAAAVQTLGKIRNASERMVREIREIGYNPTSPGNYQIATMTASTLEFTKSDGETVTIDATVPLVTLSYSSISGINPTLTDEVAGLTFSYLKSDGSAGATSSNVAFIEFELILDPGAPGNPYSQRTRVALRNQQ